MARTDIDIDEEVCEAVMRRYGLTTKRDAVNLALRHLAFERFSLDETLATRGIGWEGDLARAARRPCSSLTHRSGSTTSPGS